MKNVLKRLKAKWRWLKTQDGFHKAPARSVIRLIIWRAMYTLGIGATIRLRRWDLRMFVPARWRLTGEYFFSLREHYEPELAYLEEVLSPGKVFFDVGANLGIYTLVASRIVGKTGRVVAFEPSIQSFPGLQRNVTLNGLTNVIAFRTALSEKTGRARLYHAPDPVGNSVRGDPAWGPDTEEISLETLDRVAEQASIQRVDVIKIDAEGAEELVLRGAKRVLTAMRPVVIFEVNPETSARFGLSPYGARDLLEGLGYEFRVLHNNGTLFRPQLAPPYFNVVAMPRDR